MGAETLGLFYLQEPFSNNAQSAQQKQHRLFSYQMILRDKVVTPLTLTETRAKFQTLVK